MADLREEDYESLVMLTPDIASRIYDGLDLAIEELLYKVRELGDTGDYEPEDIQNMRVLSDDLDLIRGRLSRYFYAAQRSDA